jgi:predicted small secreted protein
MKTLVSMSALTIALALSGCGTARGVLDATRSLGGGILDDATGIVEGISEREKVRREENK